MVWDKRSIVFCLLSAFLVACGGPPDDSTREAPPPTRLLIGLIPEHNIFKQLERYDPLIRYLSERTGARIETKILSRYGNIIDNFSSAGLDGAFFGSFTYALAHEKLGVSVLARPVNLDGSSTYHGLIIVRKDSGIRTAAGQRDQRERVVGFDHVRPGPHPVLAVAAGQFVEVDQHLPVRIGGSVAV